MQPLFVIGFLDLEFLVLEKFVEERGSSSSSPNAPAQMTR